MAQMRCADAAMHDNTGTFAHGRRADQLVDFAFHKRVWKVIKSTSRRAHDGNGLLSFFGFGKRVQIAGCIETLQLLGTRFLLIAFFPFVVSHAVHDFARIVVI